MIGEEGLYQAVHTDLLLLFQPREHAQQTGHGQGLALLALLYRPIHTISITQHSVVL